MNPNFGAKLNAFGSVIDAYDGDDYGVFCEKAIADKAEELDVSFGAMWAVWDAWYVSNKLSVKNCLVFWNSIAVEDAREIGKCLRHFGINCFAYASNAGNALKTCDALECGGYVMRGMTTLEFSYDIKKGTQRAEEPAFVFFMEK